LYEVALVAASQVNAGVCVNTLAKAPGADKVGTVGAVFNVVKVVVAQPTASPHTFLGTIRNE
jgi:hypothetical protein